MEITWLGHAAFKLTDESRAGRSSPIPTRPRASAMRRSPKRRISLSSPRTMTDAHCRADLIPGDPEVVNALTVAQTGRHGRGAGACHPGDRGGGMGPPPRARGAGPERHVPLGNGRHEDRPYGRRGKPADRAQIGFFEDVDILLALAGGYLTIELPDLMKMIHRVRPKLVIPMHFRTLTYRPRNTMWIESFLPISRTRRSISPAPHRRSGAADSRTTRA
jgi:hypothetical protein